jgi:hypothetical protein
MSYDNSNSGALFINDKKSQANHPNARGQAEVVCPSCGHHGQFWMSAWTKVAKSGKKMGQKFQSLAFTAQDDQPDQKTDKEMADSVNNVFPSFDEDIPF